MRSMDSIIKSVNSMILDSIPEVENSLDTLPEVEKNLVCTTGFNDAVTAAYKFAADAYRHPSVRGPENPHYDEARALAPCLSGEINVDFLKAASGYAIGSIAGTLVPLGHVRHEMTP